MGERRPSRADSRPGTPRREVPRVHVITDDAILAGAGFPDTARVVMEAGGGGLAFHVRGPRTSGRTLHRTVEALAAVADATEALLVVNDRVDVALAVGGVGVHLGGRSLETGRVRRLVGEQVPVGRSVHGVEEAAGASGAGADYLFFGNVWPTPSHPERQGTGLEALARSAEAARPVPVLAIGGVTAARAGQAQRKGAGGVAVMRGVWGHPDPARAVTEYISALDGQRTDGTHE